MRNCTHRCASCPDDGDCDIQSRRKKEEAENKRNGTRTTRVYTKGKYCDWLFGEGFY